MFYEEQSDSYSANFLYTFHRVHKNLMRIVQKTALENDLSVPQFFLLNIIAPRKEMTQKQLGELMQIPKSTISTAIDGLVQTGWIGREPVKENRREMQLTLSEKGDLFFNSMRIQEGSIQKTVQAALQTLSEEQNEQLITTLTQIADILETKNKEPGDTKR